MVVLSVVLEIVVIETPEAYNFTYIDDYGVYANPGDNLLFEVRAKADAHVALTRLATTFTVSMVILKVTFIFPRPLLQLIM